MRRAPGGAVGGVVASKNVVRRHADCSLRARSKTPPRRVAVLDGVIERARCSWIDAFLQRPLCSTGDSMLRSLGPSGVRGRSKSGDGARSTSWRLCLMPTPSSLFRQVVYELKRMHASTTTNMDRPKTLPSRCTLLGHVNF